MTSFASVAAAATLGLVLITAAPGCATEDDTFDEVEAPLDGDAKADTASELRVRAGDTTVWMTTALTRRDGDAGPAYVLKGRASRNVLEGYTYIFDDIYGEFGLRGPRSFETQWVLRSNSAPLLEGRQQFLSLTFAHSATRPDHLTARTIVRPRLDAFAGSAAIYLVAELRPVVVAGQVVYRVTGRADGPIAAVTAARGDVAMAAHATSATAFVVDLTKADVDALAGVTGAELTVTVDQGGTPATKRAHLGLAIKVLGLTSGDAYEVWPNPTCTAETQACLAALPAGEVDLSSCGEAVVVRACRR
ncbi:MAG: hypothetical protein R3B06_30755 [Kofleriaceae bacterium]